MKKIVWLGFLLTIPCLLLAQKTITGRVIDEKNNPLEGASVYLNNTSIGTTTNDKGEFELDVKTGTYDLIASYLGYQTAQYTFNTESINRSIVFKLEVKANMLDEIVISKRKNRMSPEDRAYFMGRFKRTFLGKTNLAKECKILNEDVIDFDFDLFSKTLEVSATKPIIIEHKGLGYKIYYDLVHFELDPNKVTYLGYTRYEPLKGSKRKKKKWEEKRHVAYHGSSMHFLRSIINKDLLEEGFKIDLIERIPNPNRPSDSIIALARKKLRDHYRLPSDRVFRAVSEKVGNLVQVDAEGSVTEKKTPEEIATYNRIRDSLSSIVSKYRLKRMVDRVLKFDVTLNEFSLQKDNRSYLKFANYLKIKYMNEPEEDNFRPGPNKLDYQVSTINLLVDSAEFDKSGILINPLEIFIEGYWSYEKIADTLPLDYEPKSD